MKSKNVELDVDFIGGQEPLTKAEATAISNYFKSQKLKSSRKQASSKSRSKSTSRKKFLLKVSTNA